VKIALVSTFYDDPTTRAIFLPLSEEFRRSGNEVIFCGRRHKREELKSDPTQNGILYRIGLPPQGFLSDLINIILIPWQFLRIIKRENIDIIHFNFPQLHYVPTYLTCKFLKVPFVLVFQALPLPKHSFLNKYMLGKIISGASFVTCVSDALIQKIKELYPQIDSSKYIRIFNGVSLAEINKYENSKLAGFKDICKVPYILSVGRLMPYKGMDLLIIAFNDLIKEGYKINLVICGADYSNGTMLNLVKKLKIEKFVYFLGEITREEVFRLLANSEFFALSSRWEAFGMSILEAMALGKAVVATRTGGVGEYVKNNYSGILVDLENIVALKNAMKRFVIDTAFRKKTGMNGFKAARELNWSIIAKQYLNTYKKAVIDSRDEL